MLVRVRNPCGFPVPSQGKTAAHPSHLPSSDIQPYKQEGDVQTMKRFFLKPFFLGNFIFLFSPHGYTMTSRVPHTNTR
jgi:hypothetical protein